VTCQLGALAPGEDTTVDIVLPSAGNAGATTIDAHVISNAVDPNPTNVAASATINFVGKKPRP
jgi:hypothetical protein